MESQAVFANFVLLNWVPEGVERVQDAVGARVGDGEAAHGAQEVSKVKVDVLRPAAGRDAADVDGAGLHLKTRLPDGKFYIVA